MASKLAVTVSESTSDQVQCCWVCFCTNKEDLLAEWVQPCKCRGTVQWVHQRCLQRWVDEKQKGNWMRPVKCPHCLTEYIIVFPRMGFLMTVLHEVNEMLKMFCPFLVAGVGVVILYWTSVTYGAITVLQVMGYEDGLQLLERTQPLALIVGLPSIPVGLVLSQFFKWDDILSNFLFKYMEKDTSASNATPEIDDSSPFTTRNDTPISGSRILCSALLLPTVSAIVGRAFHNIENNLLKTVLGGLSFIAVKGVIKIILQHSEYVRKRHKRILDYNENNLSEFINNQATRSRSDSESSLAGSNTSMELLIFGMPCHCLFGIQVVSSLWEF